MAEGMIETWVHKDKPSLMVQAVRLNEENATMVAAWCGGQLIEEIDPEHPEEMQPGINVPGSMRTSRASLHNYVVKFNGAFYIMGNRNFEMLYRPVQREETPLESAGDARRQRGFADPFDNKRMGP